MADNHPAVTSDPPDRDLAAKGQPPERQALIDPFAFTPRQTTFLIAQAENPLSSTPALVRQLTDTHVDEDINRGTVGTWRYKHPEFRRAHDLIRRNPREAANFLLAWSETDALRALRTNLREGGHKAADSAKTLLAESRSRESSRAAEGLWKLIEKALDSPK